MDFDLIFFSGIAICLIALPVFVNAYSESRPPRLAAVMVALGGGMIVWAMASRPGGYALESIPDLFIATAARYLP